MKISTRGRYGLRALIDMTLHAEQGNISLSEIAQRTNISLNYLEAVFKPLKNAGIIKSTAGSLGGYRLAVPPEQLSLFIVLTVLEGDLSVTAGDECAADLPIRKFIKKNVWDRVDIAVGDTLASVTLRDMADEVKKQI